MDPPDISLNLQTISDLSHQVGKLKIRFSVRREVVDKSLVFCFSCFIIMHFNTSLCRTSRHLSSPGVRLDPGHPQSSRDALSGVSSQVVKYFYRESSHKSLQSPHLHTISS